MRSPSHWWNSTTRRVGPQGSDSKLPSADKGARSSDLTIDLHSEEEAEVSVVDEEVFTLHSAYPIMIQISLLNNFQ